MSIETFRLKANGIQIHEIVLKPIVNVIMSS